MAMGMLSRSFAFAPELMYTRTMGTVNTNTNPAPTSTRVDSLKAARKAPRSMRWSTVVASAATMSMVPGRYSGVLTAPIPVPKMSFAWKSSILSHAPTGRPGNRVRTRSSATSA